MFQYIVHKMEFFSLETLNLFLILLRNVVLPFSPPNIFVIRFRTRITGSNISPEYEF